MYHATAGAHRVAALFCLQAAFHVFDVGGRGRIDILEVFAAISLASDVRVAVWLCGCVFAGSGHHRSRSHGLLSCRHLPTSVRSLRSSSTTLMVSRLFVSWLLACFSMTLTYAVVWGATGSKALTFDELIIMLRSVLVGVAKLTNGSAPSMAACEEIAKQAFVDADSGKDGRVTYVVPPVGCNTEGLSSSLVEIVAAWPRPAMLSSRNGYVRTRGHWASLLECLTRAFDCSPTPGAKLGLCEGAAQLLRPPWGLEVEPPPAKTQEAEARRQLTAAREGFGVQGWQARRRGRCRLWFRGCYLCRVRWC